MRATATTDKAGDSMDDGTVYAGPLDGRDIYTTPADAPLTYTFKQAAEFAQNLNREKYLCHDDWRVPTKAELNVLFNNRTAIGGFNETNCGPECWYWSSSEDIYDRGWAQHFGGAGQDVNGKDGFTSLRCVRG